MKKSLTKQLLVAFTACISLNLGAAPRLEGVSEAEAQALLTTIASRISQFVSGRLAVDEIDLIAPAPLGPGFYLVSARGGRLVAVTDAQATNIMWLNGYVNIVDGKRTDLVKSVREKVGYVSPQDGGTARPRVDLHPGAAIPMFKGNRVVHVICDPNLPECVRFNNEVLKQASDLRAYIYAVSLVSPGNWREHSVRELMCWPLPLQFAQWDAIINGTSPAAAGVPGQPCSKDQQIDELTGRLRAAANPKPLPIVTLPDGTTVSGLGMTLGQFERLLGSAR